MSQPRTIVLAFDGEPSFAPVVGRLADRLSAEIATVTLDLGQGGDLEQVREQALAAGATRSHVVDARERFATEILLPALRAGAAHPAVTTPASLARPIVVAVLVEIARMERAVGVAHGASGDARAAFERLIADVAPDLLVFALEDIAPLAGSRDSEASANLWGRLERLPAGGSEDALALRSRGCVPSTAHSAPSTPAMVELTFECGQLTATNGVPMRFPELVDVMDTIAGDHGVGHADRTRRGPLGLQREIGESPAAVALSTAFNEIERAALGARLLTAKTTLAPHYAALVNDGGWWSPARRALDAFNDSAMAALTGTVRLMLFRGSCRVVGCEVGPVTATAGRRKHIGAAQPAM